MFKKMNLLLKIYISILLLFLSIVFLSFFLWLDRYFGIVDFEQLIFFFVIGIEGLWDSDDYVVNKFFQICIFLPLAITITIYFILVFIKKINNNLIQNFYYWVIKKQLLICLILFLVSITLLSKKLSFNEFLYSRTQKLDFIDQYYTDPNKINLKVDNKKNFVLIYVESLEENFSNKEIFGENLIELISPKNLNGKSFKSFKETRYTNWTIASIVATQCGIPLKPMSIFSTKKKGRHQKHVFGLKHFLPNIKCLGDILKEDNYKNIFINAVDLNFVGTGLFFKNHGYEEVYGKEEFKKKYHNFNGKTWGGGPHDSFLFQFAKKKVKELINKNELFNLTILTTDTHAPNGFLEESCKKTNNTLNDSVKCTSKNINQFIKFLKEELPNEVNILILGDHLFPGNLELREKFKDYPRNIYNLFISQENLVAKRKMITHFDFFPTILNLMGYEFNENKLGLGYSGVKEINQNFYNAYIKKLNENIQNKSKKYISFWR